MEQNQDIFDKIIENKSFGNLVKEIMMKKVQEIAIKYGVEGYLSLEEYMGCGIGACVGCVKKIKNSEKKT